MPTHQVAVAAICAIAIGAAATAQQFQFQEATPRGLAPLPLSGTVSAQFTIVDLDGDGDGDLVTGFDGDVVAFLRSPGSWTPTTLVHVGFNPESNRMIWPIDLDGDGDLDLLIGPRGQGFGRGPVYAFDNQGGGTYAPLTLPITAQVIAMLPADVDGDGDPDLVFGTTTQLLLLQNQGALSFVAVATAFPVLPNPCLPTLADFDLDGDLDLLGASNGGAPVYLQNDGTGTFRAPPSPLPAMPTDHGWVTNADLDGDGRTDGVLLRSTGQVDLLWNDVTGFVAMPDVTPGRNVRRALHADVDGGAVEVVLFDTAGVDLLRATSGRVLQRQVLAQGPAIREGVGDLDGDGRADLVIATSARSPALRQIFGGSPLVQDVADQFELRIPAGAGLLVQHPEAGDVDNDGHIDLLLPATNGLVVARALGGGRWAEPLLAAPAASTTVRENYRLLDLDGDGDLDLVTESVSALRGLDNPGDGNFGAWWSHQDAGVSANEDTFAIGDCDGDGFLDFVRLNAAGVAVYRGTASGVPAPAAIVAGPSRCLSLADFDGDGDLDLATQPTASTGGVVLANDGAGNFAPSATMALPLGATTVALGSADFDGDGDIDLVALVDLGGSLTIKSFDNGGGGVFTDVTAGRMPQVTATGTSHSDPVCADLDDDGDIDVFVVLGVGAQSGLLLVNDGTGRFTNFSSSRLATATTVSGSIAARAIDFDGDGDLDLGFGGASSSASSQVRWTNHVRQCRSLVAPYLGGTAQIDTMSLPPPAPGGLSLLFLADAAAPPTAISGVQGTVQIDTQRAVLLGFSPTSLIGVNRTFLPIPAAPALAGMELWFQHVVAPAAGPLGVGNAVVEVALP